MSSFIAWLKHVATAVSPPVATKSNDALRIGLLGASNIAPMAIITPAKSHPEVIIAAVAARDHERGKKYAEKYGIPIVHKSYQELIEDPSIDVIYNPLPNGLHYEWTIKALRAGKHVLLEKPSTSNAAQARALFNSPLLSSSDTKKAPVLLEAFHPLFHPAFQTFLGLLDRENIEIAETSNGVPKYLFPKTDIRFQTSLAGGALMDLGTYNILALRNVFGKEPVEFIEAKGRLVPGGDGGSDEGFSAKWKWDTGAIGTVDADLRRGVRTLGGWLEWLPWGPLPFVRVKHRPVTLSDVPDGQEHTVVKTVTLWNMLGSVFWHTIEITALHTIRNSATKTTIRTWTEKEVQKAYKWDDKRAGEEWWSSYRYQLEEFVNRVKGREGNGIWMEGKDSVGQMKMIDEAYEGSGLGVRPGDV